MNKQEKEYALEVWYDTRFDDARFEKARKISIEALEGVVIPNKLGRWIEGGYDDYKWVCSECGYPRYEYYEKPKAKYCECCGCPMEIER